MAKKKSGKAAQHKPAASKAVPPSPPPQQPGGPMKRPRGHGRVERGLDAVARKSEGFGRFGRMFPELAPARFFAKREDEQKLMAELGKTMVPKIPDEGAPIDEKEPLDENPSITAGYTYFGQFIDHDITFDTASNLDRDNDPSAVEDFRTARLDLDSVYGRGPTDQPYLYNSDFTIKLGADKTPGYFGTDGKKRFDVQRAPLEGDEMESKDPSDCRRAIIGDPRNDENNIVVQIHSLWQRFHNKIMAQLALPTVEAGNTRDGITGEGAFNTAQRQVRWHYQWVVLNDFLKRVVGEKMFRAVYNNGDPILKFYKPDEANYPFMPVEFSVAAYRFGHSMVRPSYSLSAEIPHMKTKLLDRLAVFAPDFSCEDKTSLNGFRPLPEAWGIDWSFYLPGLTKADNSDLPTDTNDLKFSKFIRPQPAYRIDTMLVNPLAKLPDHQPPKDPSDPDGKNISDEAKARMSLPTLNLLRGLALGLPSGQAVARRMRAKHVLTDSELWEITGNLIKPGDSTQRSEFFRHYQTQLHENAPLWYYILREAELCDQIDTVVDEKTVKLGGGHLGEVGGRIVAEVLIGLVLADDQSYLVQNPLWKPTVPAASGDAATFELADIVRFVDA